LHKEGYSQMGKPTFDPWQALDLLLRSHASQTTEVRNFALMATFQRLTFERVKSLRTTAKTYL